MFKKSSRYPRPTVASSLCALSLTVLTASSLAQEAGKLEEVIVTADPLGLLEERKTESIFGLERSLEETPRAISVISDTTMERYGIEDIDDFVTTTPGTFGGSFFGVPGAISVRGRIGDNYFRGFKRITNNGFFPLPVGASERVEIVRGPTPAIYGAGRVGGLLNFYPKTTFSEGMSSDDSATGYVSYTGGNYGKNNVTAEVNVPFLLADRETGVSLYAEYEDSEHFYRGREPQHELFQFGVNHELPNDFRIEFGGMYFNSEGYNQTPGWNRLTQDLIDNGTYITGRDTDLVDLDGSGHITRNELDAAIGSFFGVSNITTFLEFFFGPPGAGTPYDLDTGVGTAKLSRRNVLLSDRDIWESENYVLYFDLIKDFDNDSTAKLQLFYDDQDAIGALATGFSAGHEMDAFEVRASYEIGFDLSDVATLDVFTSLSHRTYNSLLRENFLAGYLVLDRQDLTVGATANDIIDNPFSVESGGINSPFDSAFDSKWETTGLAIVTDLKLWENLGILFNGRFDSYEYESVNNGTIAFSPPFPGDAREGDEDDFSWSISVNYTTEAGFVPYITYGESADPLINSNGGISPGTIASGSILADSKIQEVGVKFSLIDDTLYGALAYYDQERELVDSVGNVDLETSKGTEFELNYVINDFWAVTAAATFMDVEIADPDVTDCAGGSGQGEFFNLPPTRLGISGQNGYGGIFGVLNASCIPELADGYDRTIIPEQVHSLFVTYTSATKEDGSSYGVTFGGTYVDDTATLPIGTGQVKFPDYVVYRLAAFADFKERYSVIATVDNLFDEEYFTPLQGVFQNVAALPGTGRLWRVTAKMNF